MGRQAIEQFFHAACSDGTPTRKRIVPSSGPRFSWKLSQLFLENVIRVSAARLDL